MAHTSNCGRCCRGIELERCRNDCDRAWGGALPGLLFQYLKTLAISYLRKLQQKIQADASQIDNYLEQRVVILTNLANLVSTSVELDKEVMTTIAAYRSGIRPETDASRNAASSDLDRVMSGINVAFEKYPDLQAQDNIAEAMRQNSNLQKEITAARTLYNDTVTRWNQDIYSWPTKQIVASRAGYTTRVPFIASAEMRVLRGELLLMSGLDEPLQLLRNFSLSIRSELKNTWAIWCRQQGSMPRRIRM